MMVLKKYDPNIRWAKQQVKITLMQWAYKKEIFTSVGGNCQGFSIFDSAIANAYDALDSHEIDGEKYPFVNLVNHDGEMLECEDQELEGEDWLASMVVAMEIIDQQEDKP